MKKYKIKNTVLKEFSTFVNGLVKYPKLHTSSSFATNTNSSFTSSNLYRQNKSRDKTRPSSSHTERTRNHKSTLLTLSSSTNEQKRSIATDKPKKKQQTFFTKKCNPFATRNNPRSSNQNLVVVKQDHFSTYSSHDEDSHYNQRDENYKHKRRKTLSKHLTKISEITSDFLYNNSSMQSKTISKKKNSLILSVRSKNKSYLPDVYSRDHSWSRNSRNSHTNSEADIDRLDCVGKERKCSKNKMSLTKVNRHFLYIKSKMKKENFIKFLNGSLSKESQYISEKNSFAQQNLDYQTEMFIQDKIKIFSSSFSQENSPKKYKFSHKKYKAHFFNSYFNDVMADKTQDYFIYQANKRCKFSMVYTRVLSRSTCREVRETLLDNYLHTKEIFEKIIPKTTKQNPFHLFEINAINVNFCLSKFILHKDPFLSSLSTKDPKIRMSFEEAKTKKKRVGKRGFTYMKGGLGGIGGIQRRSFLGSSNESELLRRLSKANIDFKLPFKKILERPSEECHIDGQLEKENVPKKKKPKSKPKRNNNPPQKVMLGASDMDLYMCLNKTRGLLTEKKKKLTLPEEKLYFCIQEQNFEEFRNIYSMNNIDNKFRFSGGNTLLHFAVKSNYYNFVDFLLKNQASPNIQNDNGDTALHVACKEKCYSIIDLLLKYKVDESIKNKEGCIAWQYI